MRQRSFRSRSHIAHSSLRGSAAGPVLAFVLLVVVTASIGWLNYRQTHRALLREARSTLTAVGALKKRELESWLNTQLRFARLIQRHDWLARDLDDWLQAGLPAEAFPAITRRFLLESMEIHEYSSIVVHDPQGNKRIGLGETESEEHKTEAARALSSGEIVLVDFHRQPVGDPVSLGLMVPLQRDGVPVGALHLALDPSRFLYPLIRQWPTPSASAETILMRRTDDNRVLFLNEPRHRSGMALQLSLPMADTSLLASQASSGASGLLEGHDYRNVAVLGYATGIADTPWMLIAKMDREEVIAPLRRVALWSFGLSLVLVLMAALLIRHWRRGMILQRRFLEQRLDVLSRYANDLMLMTDGQGRILDANEHALAMYGYTREALIGQSAEILLDPKEAGEWLAKSGEILARGDAVFETEHRRKDGSTFPVEVSARRIDSEQGQFMHAVVRDIRERRLAEERFRLARELFEFSPEGIAITDADANIEEVNDAFSRITGYRNEEVCGKNPRILQSGYHENAFYRAMWQSLESAGRWRGEIWNRKKNGELYAGLLGISRLTDASGKTRHYIGIFSDITPLKQHERHLEQIAHYDPLTGMPNRVLLADRMKQALAHHQRNGKTLAICYLDLDGFKPVNDRFGHKTGDLLLKEISRRLTGIVRAEDTVARIGGDEFVLLLGGFDSPGECELLLQRIIATTAAPCEILGQCLQVSASVGVTLFPGVTADADQLLRHADQAMYVAKTSGKNRFHILDPAVESRRKANAGLLRKMADALAANQFVLHFQPRIDCRNGRVAGLEALIRWAHPVLGLRAPGEFLPLIEHEDFVVTLGEWSIRETLRLIQDWDAQGIDLPVAVNLSARHLLDGDFATRLEALLQACPARLWSRLEFDLAETAALQDVEAVSNRIEQCRRFGIRFSLDDFGTGHSSLAHLKRLPIDAVKIDRSLVQRMGLDPGDLAVVHGIVSLGTSFRKGVSAEGVESIEQVLLLLDLGCERMQGHALARPMTASGISAWLRSFRPDPRWQAALGEYPSRTDFDLLLMEVIHRHWIDRVEASFAQANLPPPSTTYDACTFTRWCEERGKKHFGRLPDFYAMIEAHRKVHQLAAIAASGNRGANGDPLQAAKEANQVLIAQISRFRQKHGHPRRGHNPEPQATLNGSTFP